MRYKIIRTGTDAAIMKLGVVLAAAPAPPAAASASTTTFTMSAMAAPSASNMTSSDLFDKLSNAATAGDCAADIKGDASGNNILVGAGTPSNEEDETIGLLAPRKFYSVVAYSPIFFKTGGNFTFSPGSLRHRN